MDGLVLRAGTAPPPVMRGLDPRIHDETPRANPYGVRRGTASWIAGSSPAMTTEGWCVAEVNKVIREAVE
jgi:hypothetical protein